MLKPEEAVLHLRERGLQLLLKLCHCEMDIELKAVLSDLHDALDEGSLYIPLPRNYPGFTKRLLDGDYSALIGSPGDFTPVILYQDKLFFEKIYRHETSLIHKLGCYTGLDIESVPDEIQAMIASWDLHPLQKAAVKNCLTRRFTVLTGGPGTGKTATMVAMVRALLAKGIGLEHLALCAPTGRAAQRMQDALEQGGILSDQQSLATTIHRLLGYNPRKNGFSYDEHNPLPISVLIVDEVSMVDVILMSRLLSALNENNTRLILIGDPDQLPSVEAGAVLASLLSEANLNRYRDHVTRLTHVFRSKTKILQVAQAVNSGTNPALSEIPLPSSSDWKMPEDSVVQIREDFSTLCTFYEYWLNDYVQVLKDPDLKSSQRLHSLFAIFSRCRILCLAKEGQRGVYAFNEHFSQRLRRDLNHPQTSEPFFHGLPVLVLANLHQKEVYNGDQGIVLSDTDGNLQVWFLRGKSLQSLYVPEMPLSQPAFAMTVHKSQGSEFQDVLLVLPDLKSPLLSREILYTGITRAKDRVFLAADPPILSHAISSTRPRRVR